MPTLPETPNGWLGSTERSEALKLAAARGLAARATGLLDGELSDELRASFERTAQQVARYLNVPVGLFSLLDGDCQMIVATSGVALPEILPAEGSMCVHVRDSGRDVIIDDLSRHELGDLASNMTAVGANAYMGTPVFSPDGQPIGSLCAIDFPSRGWEPNDLDLLRSLAEGLTDKLALIQARARAEASEARMAATIEALPNVVYVFEPGGEVGYVSPQVEEQFGIDPGAFRGFGYLRHMHPEDARALLAGIRAREGEPQGFEREFRLRDDEGRWRELLAIGRPFRDADGAIGYIVTTTEIGAFRETERALKHESARLAALMEALPHIVFLSSPENGVEYVSPQIGTILGYRPEEMTGFAVYERVIAPEDRNRLRGERQRLLGRPEPFEQEITVLHADGHRIPILLRGFPLNEGVGHSHVITFTDVTERNASRQLIAAEGELMRQIMENSPIMSGLCDPEGRLLYTNAAPLQAAGVTLAEVVGQYLWETPWAREEGVSELLRDACARAMLGETVLTEMSFPGPNGLVEVETRVAPIYGSDGRLQYLHPSAIDVTARNRALRAVQAEGSRLQQVMDHSPMMKTLMDPEGRVLYMNDLPLRAFGLTLEDVRGKPIWELARVLSPTAPEHFREFYDRALRGETVLDEFTVPAMDGRNLELEHRMAVIHDEHGEVISLLSTAMDVTARNAATREIDKERARLRTVLDVLPAGLLIADAEGRIVDGNAEGWRLVSPGGAPNPEDFDWPRAWYQEFDGTETLIHAGEGPMPAALEGRSVREPRTIRVLNSLGSIRFIKCDAEPLRGPDGEVTGAVMTVLDVTDLRLALDEVAFARAESISRMERVIDSLPINVVLADKEGRLLYANETPLRGAGLKLDDIVGQLAWESPWMPNEEVAQIVQEEYMKAAGGEVAKREFSIQMGEQIVDIDHSVVPIFDRNGDVEFLLPSSIDVTARNRALGRAEEERRRLGQIVENLPIGLFVFDRNREILQANDEALSASGRTREQLDRHEYAEATYVELDGSETPLDLENSPLTRALRGDSGREPRVLRLHYPGTDVSEDRYVRAEAGALTGADGTVDGAVYTIIDVKPLREAELALERERRAATERLTATLEGISIFVWLLDLEGRIVWCNRTFLEASGYRFEEMETLRFWETPWTEHDRTMADALAAATREAAEGVSRFVPITARSVTGPMDVDVTLSTVRDEEGAVKYLVASGMNVTERNASLRQVVDARMSAERAREIAERATRAKDEFLAVLSHELRTPLTPAMLGLELLGGDLDEILPLTGDADLAASIQETMGTVRSNLDIQVRLIDDLLDVTRIARGKLELRLTEIDVHDAARHALSIVAPRAEEKGILLLISPDASRSLVSADPARLRQIFWNLLANAVKFTDPGGTIRIETEDAGPFTVRVKIVDTGLGIEPERLGTIFDAFDQGDGSVSRGFGGLGLGLAIARSLARAHGGTLWAASSGRGQGATFVLDLPTIERGPETERPRARTKVRQSHRGCRILLIEDNLDTARFTAFLLRRAEIDVTVAHSVADAVDEGSQVPNEHWDAILTDIGLPDGDGLEAVLRLRGLGVQAPAVAMSGYGRDEDKARTADAGFRAHLVKPISLDRLLEVLDEVLPECSEES